MTENLIVFFANKHIEFNRNYAVVSSTIAVDLLSDLYEKSLVSNEIYGLQTLNEETLDRYEKIAEIKADERKPKEKIIKACYILDYITS